MLVQYRAPLYCPNSPSQLPSLRSRRKLVTRPFASLCHHESPTEADAPGIIADASRGNHLPITAMTEEVVSPPHHHMCRPFSRAGAPRELLPAYLLGEERVDELLEPLLDVHSDVSDAGGDDVERQDGGRSVQGEHEGPLGARRRGLRPGRRR